MTTGGLILNLSETIYYGQEVRLRREEKGDTVRDHYFRLARRYTLFLLFKRLVSRFRLKRVTISNTLYVHVYFINGFKKCATLSCRRWMQKSRKGLRSFWLFLSL